MLKVKTTRFSDIEVNEEDIIKLPSGLVGFPDLVSYVLLDHDKESPFKWLQSLDDGAIAFVLINPLLFKPDYTVEVSESEVGELDLTSEEDAIISVIITMPSNPQNMTANLKAPLIFNLKNRTGKQIVLNSSDYTTRHNIMEEVRRRESESNSSALQEAIEKVKETQNEVEKPRKKAKK